MPTIHQHCISCGTVRKVQISERTAFNKDTEICWQEKTSDRKIFLVTIGYETDTHSHEILVIINMLYNVYMCSECYHTL